MSDNELDTYRLNNTKNLLEDSFYHNNPYTSSVNSNMYKRLNNTAYLLGEKTSMMVDGKVSKISQSKHFTESQTSLKSLSSVMKNIPKQDDKKEDSDIENGYIN
jgi:hypothetical protein